MQTREPLLSVVVVTQGGLDPLARCLASVFEQALPGGVEAILVDNASRDGAVAAVAARFPQVRVLRHEENLGFAAANNRGIAASSGRYILLLNDDAWLAPGCAAHLIEALSADPGLATAGPRIYRGADRRFLDSTGIVLNKHRLRPYDRGEGEPAAGRYLAREEVFGATGACLLIRREAVADLSVGGELFDEDFFAYYEDVDLAWRQQVQGWRSLYVPEAEAFHERRGPEGKPTAVKKRFLVNRYFCYVKNEPGSLAWRYLPWLVLLEAARLGRRFVSEPRLVGAVPLFLRLLPRMIGKRRAIRARRKAPSTYLKRFR